jgi:hypothetical protein
MTIIKLPENPHAAMKETFTPPIGLWSMRENNEEYLRIFDGQLEGLGRTRAFMKELSLGETVGFSIQFQTQEALLQKLLPFTTGPVTVGGPHGSTLKSGAFKTHFGPGETESFEKLIPPHPSEESLLPYWKKQAPFGKPQSNRWLPIETSRGCPNRCDFCAMGSFWGSWKARPLDMLEEYVRWLKFERDISEVIILDDNVSLEKERFISIVEMLTRYGVRWSAPNGIYLRSILDPDVITALRASTCVGLSLPFETANRETARAMNLHHKWLWPGEAQALVHILREKIPLTGFFIIGYPGETEEDVKETLKFANSLPLQERHIYFAAPYPGSHLYETCRRRGWLLPEAATFRTACIETPWLSRSRLQELFNADRAAALARIS